MAGEVQDRGLDAKSVSKSQPRLPGHLPQEVEVCGFISPEGGSKETRNEKTRLQAHLRGQVARGNVASALCGGRDGAQLRVQAFVTLSFIPSSSWVGFVPSSSVGTDRGMTRD